MLMRVVIRMMRMMITRMVIKRMVRLGMGEMMVTTAAGNWRLEAGAHF